MPTLEWIGKNKVINHHLEVPFRVLERKYSFDEQGQHAEDNGSANMIIKGDNLEALKSLLPKYEGKIKCIYIDPPYNTGNEGWVYNDNVNDPKIKKWLGEVVGKEGEDLSRHDKWLCMMYPRLRLLQKLLSANGCLVISINGFELANIIELCKEIFANMQVQVVTVQTSGGKPSAGFNISHESLIFVAPLDFIPNYSEAARNEYASPYHGMNLATFNQTQRPNQAYPIFVDENGVLVAVGKSLQERIDDGEYSGPLGDFSFDYDNVPAGTVAVWPVTNKGDSCVWRLIPSRVKNDWEHGYIKILPQKSKKNRNLFTVQYLAEGIIEKIEKGELETYRFSNNDSIPTIEIADFKTGGVGIPTIWTDKRFYTTKGNNQLTEIFGKKGKFPYPKPVDFIAEILQRVTDGESIILDSFAGSGTTGHAVLKLNQEGVIRNQFILVEMEDYAEATTAERVKRVISGYDYEGTQEVEIFNHHLSLASLKEGTTLLEEANAVIESKKSEFAKIGKPTIKDNMLKVIGTKVHTGRMEGLGGNFSFYELGELLLIDGENLNENVGVEKIREYVWFMETKQPFVEPTEKDNDAYLGAFAETAYYLHYEREQATTLDHEFIGSIKNRLPGYVVYADLNALSADELKQFGIIFKKIPRDIAKL